MVESPKKKKHFVYTKKPNAKADMLYDFFFIVFEVLGKAILSYHDSYQNTVCFSWNELADSKDEGNFQETNMFHILREVVVL